MSIAPVAEFIDVVKDYRLGLLRRRTVRAVAGVSFRVEQGEVFGLLGPNRAGKTTLVKLLLSLSHPTSGVVLRLGQPARDRRTLAKVGYVHENHAFPRYLSGRGLLEFYGPLTFLPNDIIKQRVPKLLEKVGLADRSQDPVATFSKGMIQRLGVAQALLNEPDLLVLDEPNEGLDMAARQIVLDAILEQKKQGRSAILVSHVLPEVEQYCDRVAVLQEGKLVHYGAVAELTGRGVKGGKTRSLEQALQGIYQKTGK